MTVVRVERRTILLQTNPSVQEQRCQTIASLAPKRCTRLEPAAEFWRVDAEQAHSPDGCHVYGVAIDDRSDQDWIRSRDAPACRSCLKKCSSNENDHDQNLHGVAPFPANGRGWRFGVQARGPHRWPWASSGRRLRRARLVRAVRSSVSGYRSRDCCNPSTLPLESETCTCERQCGRSLSLA